jgi:hypothetical protein
MRTRTTLPLGRASAALALLLLPWAGACRDVTAPQRAPLGPSMVISPTDPLYSANCSPIFQWSRLDGSAASSSITVGQKYTVKNVGTCAISTWGSYNSNVVVSGSGYSATVQATSFDPAYPTATIWAMESDGTVWTLNLVIARAYLSLSDHATLDVGSTANLYFEVTEGDGHKIPRSYWPKDPTFTSDNSAVATATIGATSGSGANVIVSGRSAGSTAIRTTFLGSSTVSYITVNALPAASVTLNSTAVTGIPGAYYQFVATVKDANGNTLSKPVTWTSSNTAVETVDATGKATSVSPGTAVVRAQVDGVYADATVNVMDASCRDCSGSITPGMVVPLQ